MSEKHNNLQTAKVEKNDEFYTLYDDVKHECDNYRSKFKNKVIYCNCDNPVASNFFLYFVKNFKALQLKGLMCTCYDGDSSLHTRLDKVLNIEHTPTKAYKLVINDIMDMNDDGSYTEKDVKAMFKDVIDNGDNSELVKQGYVEFELLHSDENYLAGDFRSKECVELLEKCDIIVTNPPFSLFREFIALLEKYEKKYLVIGNQNAITYKEIFPLIKENKIWLGYHYVKEFLQPDGTMKSFGNILWYTNLPTRKRTESLFLDPERLYYNEDGTVNSDEYPTYDNYEAINVNEIKDIPCDYIGIIGVPITFLGKYCPAQFEIIGHEHDINGDGGEGLKEGQFEINGIGKYKRILIKRKEN